MEGTSISGNQVDYHLLKAAYDCFPNGVALLGIVKDVTGRVDDFRVRLLNAQIFNAIADKNYHNKSYESVLPMMSEAKISHKFKLVAESGLGMKFETSYGYNKMKRWFLFNVVKQNDLLVVTTEDITDRKIAEQVTADQFNALDEKQNIYRSELKRMEELMLESEQRFRTMIEKAPVAIGLTRGKEFIFESINEPMIRLIGKTTKKQVLGRSLAEVLPELQQQAITSILQRVLRTGDTFHGTEVPAELMMDGQLTLCYFNISYTRFFDSDGEARLLHMAIDVTQQVLARRTIEASGARLKSVIEQTPVATLVLRGKEFIIEQINNPMLKIIEQREDVIGKSYFDLPPTRMEQFGWGELRQAYHEGVNIDQQYVPIEQHNNGVKTISYYNISVHPLREEGEITGVIMVASDIKSLPDKLSIGSAGA